MIQVDDKNKFTMSGDDPVKEASRISIALIELTRKLNELEPKIALSFLRVVHSMTNGLAQPIVEQMDKEAEAHLKGKMKEKREEKKRRKALKEAAMNGGIIKIDMTKGADRIKDEDVSSEVTTKGEFNNGNTEQYNTTSSDATNTGEFDSIRDGDKSDCGNSSNNS